MPSKTIGAAVLGCSLTLVLGACGAQVEDKASSTMLPTESAAPDTVRAAQMEVEFRCYQGDGTPVRITGVVPQDTEPKQFNWKAVWAEKFASCENPVRSVDGRVLAGDEDFTLMERASRMSPSSLYKVCASVADAGLNVEKARLKHGEAARLYAAKDFCPAHPKRKVWSTNLDRYEAMPVEFESGEQLEVGFDVQPGRYVSYPDGGCYWARYDREGGIIENSYSGAPRVVVTIDEGDYAFTSKRCGTWYPE